MNLDINSVKNFWNARPCNIRHSMSPINTKEYFDEVEKRKYFVEPHIPEFAQFSNWKNKKVLEIGCGIGTDAVNFARAGAIYTGIELSEKSLEITKKRFDTFNLKGKFYCGNAEDISEILPNDTYDLIYSFGVIHHTVNPSKVISSIKKYMHQDSLFKLMLYAKNSWKNYMIEAGLDQPEAQTGCPIAFVYDKQELQELLKDYDIVNMYQKHIFPYVIEKYVNYEYELQSWFKAMPPELFKILEDKLGWHTLITCKVK